MKLQRLLSLTRQAVDTYQMIEQGDRVAVGLSGGKDSLTLLYALHGLQRFYPKSFKLEAITVDLGHPEFDSAALSRFCEQLGVPYTVVKTEIAKIVFEARKEPNPCSLCSRMRKGALNDAAKAHGCTKIAYAHHMDDAVETMLLSLIFEGRFHSFPPRTHLERTGLTVIRPLLFVQEADIVGFSRRFALPVAKSGCPANGRTTREYAKTLLRELNRNFPGVKERMFTAIRSAHLPDWPD